MTTNLGDSFVGRKHGEDNGFCGLVKDLEDLGGGFGQEVGEDVALVGQIVILHLETGAIFWRKGKTEEHVSLGRNNRK